MPAWQADISSVWDGDTFDCLVAVGFFCYAGATIRPIGYDAPERWTAEGEAARDYLLEVMPVGSTVTLASDQVNPERSFARYLCRVLLPDSRDLAEVMISSGHGQPYQG